MKNFNFKIFLKRVKHSLQHIGSDADKDWRILLSLFIVSIAISVIWHINIYVASLGKEFVIDTKNNDRGASIEALSKMTDVYDNRAFEFQKLLEDKKILIDPAR